MIATDVLGPTLRRVRIGIGVWVVLLVLGGGAAMGLIGVYSLLAERGILGQEAQLKYEAQTANGEGVVLGGRGEVLVSTRAIVRSPIIGHGSWAKDVEYKMMLVSLLRDRGVNAKLDLRTGEGIPSHSYFFQTWVEHGVVGAVFWAVAFIMACRSIPQVMRLQPMASPIFFLATCSLLWAIPFTPFGAENRFFAAGQLAIVVWALREARLRYGTRPFRALSLSRTAPRAMA